MLTLQHPWVQFRHPPTHVQRSLRGGTVDEAVWNKILSKSKKAPFKTFKSWSYRIIAGLIGELFVLVISVHCIEHALWPMRPQARGLAQHGSPLAGWRRGIRQVWFYTWWTGRTACPFRTVPVALTGAAQLRADRISSCCYIVNIYNHPSWAMSRKEAWPGTLVDTCLLSDYVYQFKKIKNLGQRSSILIRPEKRVEKQENLPNWPWHFVHVNRYSELKYSNSHWSSYLP